MLNELDKELEARKLNFVRYADDCIILVRSEKAANRVLESITKFIERKLGLKVNVEKSKVTRPTQTKYLGFSFWVTKGGKWKIRTRENALTKLVVEPKLAHQVACTRKGYYQICKTTYIQFAINTERLRKRGLVFLLDQYNKVHIECIN